MSGKHYTVALNFGVTVRYDGNHYMDIKVIKEWVWFLLNSSFITWFTFEYLYMLVIILQLWGQTLWAVWGLQRRLSGWLPDPNWWTGPKPQWLWPQLEHRPWVRHYAVTTALSLLTQIIETSPLIPPSGVTSQRLVHPQGVQMLRRSCMKVLLTVVSYWTAMAHLLLAIQKSTPMWVKSNLLMLLNLNA